MNIGRSIRTALHFTIALTLVLGMPSLWALAPALGDSAPEFNLAGSDGERHQLSDYRGSFVVLAWFSRAYFGGSTAECISLRNSGVATSDFDVALFMISVDDIRTVTNFGRRYKATFPVLSDSGKATARAYGVLGSYNYATSRTYYIDPNGIIVHIDNNVKPSSAGANVNRILRELGVAGSGESE